LKNKKRVLLVEDEPNSIELTQLELEVLGYEVTVAENGVEGVEMAASLLPDIIVMDIRMPKMDGLRATSQIRKDPKTKDIPILAATARAMAGDKEKCLAAGCDSYISKPFSYKELGDAVEKLLRER
jgi:two-component system cell cycle response regulator DivK